MDGICEFMSSVVDTATVIATLVAIIGIVQTQIQFKENIKLQNRSINLSLFDERVSVFELIKKENYDFSRERASFLFNEEIMSLIENRDQITREKDNYESIQRQLVGILCDSVGEGSPNYPDLIHKYQNFDPGINCTQEEHDQIRKILTEHPMTFQIECLDFSYHTFTFVEVDDKLTEFYQELQCSQAAIIEAMKSFIKSSISGGKSREK